MENASKLGQGSVSSESIENLIRDLAMDRPKRFSHEDLINFTSNFNTKIGFGGFGNVYKGQFPGGVEVAVKVLLDNGIVEEVFTAEVITMGRAYHRNLVKLYGFCYDANMKALVYEYLKNGSLDKVLFENQFNIKWEKLYGIAVETAKGLLYLHDGCYEQIIHHDIKPGNVLLQANLSPKITDFGLAKLLNRDVSHLTMTRIRGTPGYAAPETFTQSSKVTFKCDVYSFGMMLFEILGRRRNHQGKEWFPKQVWEKFEAGQLNEIIDNCGISEENREKAKNLCMVALWCIQFTPETRPSMSSVLTMLEKEIQVRTPPNPFFSSDLIFSMQQSQPFQEVIHSKVFSFSDERKLVSSKPVLQESKKNIVERPSTSTNFRMPEEKTQDTEPSSQYNPWNTSKQSSRVNKVERPSTSNYFEMPKEMQVTEPPNWYYPSKHSSTQNIVERPSVSTNFRMPEEKIQVTEPPYQFDPWNPSVQSSIERLQNPSMNTPSWLLAPSVTTPSDPFMFGSNSSTQALQKHSIPEQDAVKPNEGGGAENAVTEWYPIMYTVNYIDTGVRFVGTNSNLELVIKANARINDPRGGMIVKVLPRPKLLKHMNYEEIQQLLSQCSEGIRLIISNTNSAESAREEYWDLYKELAVEIPSLKRIKRKLREMD